MTRAHTYSVERLVHYQCGTCRGWWSIGDGPQHGSLVCPWCKEEGALEPATSEAPPTPEATDEEGIPFVEDDGTLEPWAAYIATDDDGLAFQHEGRPTFCPHGRGWGQSGPRVQFAPDHYALTDRPWTETLRRIKR